MVDTRAGEFNVGPRTTPLGANDTHTVAAVGNSGECIGIPTTATGLQLNVTAVNATAPTFLTIWAAGTRPKASSLNPSPQQPPAPNAVTTGLSTSGQFQVYNRAGSVELIVDVVGYYSDHDHDDRYFTQAEVVALVAATGGAAAGSTDGGEEVDVSAEIITSVSVETPTNGVVIATAITSIFGIDGPTRVRCSITTGTGLDNHSFTSDVDADQWATLAGTRAFVLDAAPTGGKTTVNLVCDSTVSSLLGDTNLTVAFAPDNG